MRTREEIEKDIKNQKEKIQLEKLINENSGSLSFLYHQLHELESELEDYEEEHTEI